jgi:hypothetical protein
MPFFSVAPTAYRCQHCRRDGVDWTGERVSEFDIVPEIAAHVIGPRGQFERSSRAWITPGFVAVGRG